MPRLAAFAQTSAALSRIHLKSVATLWAVVPLDAWRDNCAGKVPIGVRVAASQQRCGATAADPTSDLDDPFRPSKARAARNRAQGERSIPRITVHVSGICSYFQFTYSPVLTTSTSTSYHLQIKCFGRTHSGSPILLPQFSFSARTIAGQITHTLPPQLDNASYCSDDGNAAWTCHCEGCEFEPGRRSVLCGVGASSDGECTTPISNGSTTPWWPLRREW